MKTLWKMKGYLLEEPFSQNKSGRGCTSLAPFPTCSTLVRATLVVGVAVCVSIRVRVVVSVVISVCVRVAGRRNLQLVPHRLHPVYSLRHFLCTRFLGRARHSSAERYDRIGHVNINRRITQIVRASQVETCFHPQPAIVQTRSDRPARFLRFARSEER